MINSNKTVIKHYQIFLRYTEMVNELKSLYPVISLFVAQSYYYGQLSDEYELTPNYICSIVCGIMQNPTQAQRDYEIALMDHNL